MTLNEVADEINKLFRDYGLSHDVVRVSSVSRSDSNVARLVFIQGHSPDAMELLLTTLREVFKTYGRDHQGHGHGVAPEDLQPIQGFSQPKQGRLF